MMTAIFSGLGLFFWSMGCTEKRILPEAPKQEIIYDIELQMIWEGEQLQRDVHWNWEVHLIPQQTFGDDSLGMRLYWETASFQEGDMDWLESPLQGKGLNIRVFTWGELLSVDGLEQLRDIPDAQLLDGAIGAIFPNSPQYKSEIWLQRLQVWPYSLPNEPYSKQLIRANWERSDDHVHYDGEWYGKKGQNRLFEGAAKGDVWRSSPWIDRHDFQWTRSLLEPYNATQQLRGHIVKRELIIEQDGERK